MVVFSEYLPTIVGVKKTSLLLDLDSRRIRIENYGSRHTVLGLHLDSSGNKNFALQKPLMFNS